MGSIVGHRIDYNAWGGGSERPAAHTQQNLTQVPLRGYLYHSVQHPNKMLFAFTQPRYVLSMFLNFEHFQPHFLIKMVLIKTKRVYLDTNRFTCVEPPIALEIFLDKMSVCWFHASVSFNFLDFSLPIIKWIEYMK